MRIHDSELSYNKATDGGIIYAMANKVSALDDTKFIDLKDENGNTEASLVLKKSLLSNNFAQQNPILIIRSSMRIKDCEIADNYALTVTHGLTMIASEVFVESTKIWNTEPFLKWIKA